MPETLQEYLQRLESYLGDRDPLKVQAATAKKLAQLIKRVPRRKLMRRPAPGKWSIGEIVAHLADDELVGAYRIRKILEEPGTAIQSFDQTKWAATGKYAQSDPAQSLALFRTLREANLALLKSLEKKQWNQHGVHAQRGVESIAAITKHFACHDLNHLKQIETILAGSSRS